MNFAQIQNNLNEINDMLDQREKEVTYSQSQPSVYYSQPQVTNIQCRDKKYLPSKIKPAGPICSEKLWDVFIPKKSEYIPSSSRQYKDEKNDIVRSFNKYKAAVSEQAQSKVFREIQNVESLNAGDYARWTTEENIPRNRKSLCVTSDSPIPDTSNKIINPLKADYSKLNTFYDKSLEKINNMEMQMIKLERQLKESL